MYPLPSHQSDEARQRLSETRASDRAEEQVSAFPVEETSIAALGAAYRSGRTTARAVTQAHLQSGRAAPFAGDDAVVASAGCRAS